MEIILYNNKLSQEAQKVNASLPGLVLLPDSALPTDHDLIAKFS